MRVENIAASDFAVQAAARLARDSAPAARTETGGPAPNGNGPPVNDVRAARPVEPVAEEGTARAPSASSLAAVRPRFDVDQATERLVAEIVDENNEVIKQIPPQELLDAVARFRRLQSLLFDESV